MKRKDPEECRHPMSRRVLRRAVVLKERITVEACLDCGLKLLDPRDSARLLGDARKQAASRR